MLYFLAVHNSSIGDLVPCLVGPSRFLPHLTRTHTNLIHIWVCVSPVLKSANLEFDNYQSIFVWHFAYQSIPTTNVLAKYRSFLWNWTPSHIQRIYKGQNSENPLRAITFDWCVLQTWDQRLWAAFLMLFSGIPHLPTFCHVVCVTYVTSHVSRASRMSRVKCRVR